MPSLFTHPAGLNEHHSVPGTVLNTEYSSEPKTKFSAIMVLNILMKEAVIL